MNINDHLLARTIQDPMTLGPWGASVPKLRAFYGPMPRDIGFQHKELQPLGSLHDIRDPYDPKITRCVWARHKKALMKFIIAIYGTL